MLKALDEDCYRPVSTAVRVKPRLSGERRSFFGVWRSEGGSLYLYDGGRFVCIAVHHARFYGWVDRCAVKDVRTVGSVYSGLQAFRCGSTGALLTWAPITISLENDIVTKFFPAHIPSHLLVYGHIERYFRVPYDKDGRYQSIRGD
jgi:hypothetical protein